MKCKKGKGKHERHKTRAGTQLLLITALHHAKRHKQRTSCGASYTRGLIGLVAFSRAIIGYSSLNELERYVLLIERKRKAHTTTTRRCYPEQTNERQRTHNTYTPHNTHTHTHIPPWEDQCEWHRMTRMTGPDCAVMCNLINRHTHT